MNPRLPPRALTPFVVLIALAATGVVGVFACAPMEGAEDLSGGNPAPTPTPTPSGSAAPPTDAGPTNRADASPSTPPTDAEATPDDPDFLVKRDAVFVDGTAQRVVVMEPRRATAAQLPIVVVYHPDESSADAFREQWPLYRVSGQNAVVVYADDSTNASAWGGAGMTSSNAFATGFEKIVQRMTQIYDGDATRVFVVGMSSGGAFANLVACRYSGSTALTLRSAIVMSGAGPNATQTPERFAVSDYPKCANQKPLSTLVVHGKTDATPGVGFADGQWAADYWTYVNRVLATPPLAAPEDTGDAASTTPLAGFPAPCRKYADSPGDRPVALCAVDGLGHALWPESTVAAWQWIGYTSP